MANIDPKLVEILQKYHPDPKAAVWNCHGTWVAYHRACEIIARAAKITFDPPMVLEAHGEKKVAALCVTGHMNGATEWSIGEAAPSNCKNAYPFAMAEKRAKDRVILKLIGLHGEVYSEAEADEFKKGTTALKDWARQFVKDLAICVDTGQLEGLIHAWQDELAQLQAEHPTWYYGDGDKTGIRQRINEKRKELDHGV